MKNALKHTLLLCLLLAGWASTAFGQNVLQKGIYTDDNCKYSLFYSYAMYNGHVFSQSYYALIIDFVNTSSYVTVPATVTVYDEEDKRDYTYSVLGISDEEYLSVNSVDHNIYSLTFEGDVTTWGNPIKVKGGFGGFTHLKFQGRSYPFNGDISNYLIPTSGTSLNNVHISLVDKNELQIAELMNTAPWNQVFEVAYNPIKLNLTTNITQCPETNYSEDVALYRLGNYTYFSDANYDLDKLTLMNYTSPGVYEVNKYESYVLVARYNKNNVDMKYTRGGISWSMGTFNNLDYDEIIGITSNLTLDLTFTWKTTLLSFIQVGATESIPYSIAGKHLISGTLTEPLGSVSNVASDEILRLTLPATTHALDKVVFKAGNAEQVIAAPEPANGNYNVNITIPTDMKSYVYIYWKEKETSKTFKFLRYGGGTNKTWMMWQDGGVYDYDFPEGYSETTIPNEQLTTDLKMYLDVMPGWTFKVFKDNVDITTQFANDYNPTEYWKELDKESATYTVCYEEVGGIITFADPTVKELCVENWDTNDDGELSMAEAAAVTSLLKNGTSASVFGKNTEITQFDELQYFTGLTAIPQSAFYGDSALTSVVIPQSVARIEAWSFRDCVNLEHVALPDSLAWIDSGTFMNTAIKQTTLPSKGSLMLGYSVFQGTPLRSLYIPANLTATIYRDVVSKCPDLANISVDEGNKYYDSREGCNAIIKKSTNTLIAGCKNTVIPKSVKALGDHAFYYAPVKKLELPAGLESMGEGSIFRCDSLTSIVAHMPVPFEITIANIGLINNCVLTVPFGKRDAYIAAGWTESIFKGGVVEEAKTNDGDVNCDGEVNVSDVTTLVNIILHH
ncbi:MAG: leucine-rich repeat protein [Bacteroidaceae bacterium]|nr:leucine-rich repeat protein [Bacteroidaceae bacterium]